MGNLLFMALQAAVFLFVTYAIYIKLQSVIQMAKPFLPYDENRTTPVARGVTLSCPHCGGQTEAARNQCQHCSKEL